MVDIVVSRQEKVRRLLLYSLFCTSKRINSFALYEVIEVIDLKNNSILERVRAASFTLENESRQGRSNGFLTGICKVWESPSFVKRYFARSRLIVCATRNFHLCPGLMSLAYGLCMDVFEVFINHLTDHSDKKTERGVNHKLVQHSRESEEIFLCFRSDPAAG